MFSAVIRHIRLRPRLATASFVGLALAVLLPGNFSGAVRALIAWDVGASLYLLFAWKMMLKANVKGIRAKADQQDDGAVAVLVLTIISSVASLAAILIELMGAKEVERHIHGSQLALAAVTIIISWCIVHTTFALHYAHAFYAQDGDDGVCLEFPGNKEPDYVDFLYFAFVLGMTAQTSDVVVSSSPMRRLVLVHGVIAFFFNTTLLALTINIAAGLI